MLGYVTLLIPVSFLFKFFYHLRHASSSSAGAASFFQTTVWRSTSSSPKEYATRPATSHTSCRIDRCKQREIQLRVENDPVTEQLLSN